MGHEPYTYEETVKAANQAFKEGRLGFQKLERAKEGCLYRYSDGGCCAIGAILSDSLARDSNSRGTVHRAFDKRGILEQEEGLVLDCFLVFQKAHDLLCDKVNLEGISVEEAEAKWRKKYIEGN